MYDVVGGFKGLWRQAARRRGEQTIRRLRHDLDSVRRDLDDVRRDGSRSTAMKRLAETVSNGIPARRRRPSRVAMSMPVVAMAGLGGLAVMLMWDDRRRAAMRRRLDEVASTVTPNRSRASEQPAAPSVPTGQA